MEIPNWQIMQEGSRSFQLATEVKSREKYLILDLSIDLIVQYFNEMLTCGHATGLNNVMFVKYLLVKAYFNEQITYDFALQMQDTYFNEKKSSFLANIMCYNKDSENVAIWNEFLQFIKKLGYE